MNNLRKIANSALRLRNLHQATKLQHGTLYEPDYLEAMKSKVPLYDTINIQLRGYDFPIIESYQKFVHNMLKNMDVDVEECWSTPHQELQVTTYKAKSDVINSQYNLKIYERTVQITDLPCTQLTNVLRAVEASTPAGVTVQLVPHEEYHEEVRYVPDTELISLKNELDEMGGPSKKKN